jgi:hypothetical protein
MLDLTKFPWFILDLIFEQTLVNRQYFPKDIPSMPNLQSINNANNPFPNCLGLVALLKMMKIYFHNSFSTKIQLSTWIWLTFLLKWLIIIILFYSDQINAASSFAMSICWTFDQTNLTLIRCIFLHLTFVGSDKL